MVDFAEVKRITTIQHVAEWLGFNMRANRMDCPHSSSKRSIVINPQYKNKDGSLGNFRCFSCNEYGDLIQLAAHVNKQDVKTAAKEIMGHFHGYTPNEKGLTNSALDKVISEMQWEHPEVQEIGLTPEKAKELCIGYRLKGTKPKSVLIPIRDDKGVIIDFIGYSREKGLKFSSFQLK